MIGMAVKVMRIATGEEQEELDRAKPPPSGAFLSPRSAKSDVAASLIEIADAPEHSWAVGGERRAEGSTLKPSLPMHSPNQARLTPQYWSTRSE